MQDFFSDEMQVEGSFFWLGALDFLIYYEHAERQTIGHTNDGGYVLYTSMNYPFI